MASGSLEVSELTEREMETLEVGRPEIQGHSSGLVITGPRGLLSSIAEIVQQMAYESRREQAFLDALSKDVEAQRHSASHFLQLESQARARAQFLEDVPTLTSSEVSRLAGSEASNTSALASRWKSEGKIFAVADGRTHRFPVFQFGDDGKPRAVVRKIIEAFAKESDWTLALWFTSSSGWLDGRHPLDVLDSDPEAVIEAAHKTTRPLAL